MESRASDNFFFFFTHPLTKVLGESTATIILVDPQGSIE